MDRSDIPHICRCGAWLVFYVDEIYRVFRVYDSWTVHVVEGSVYQTSSQGLFVNIAYIFVESKKELERQAQLEEERLKDLAGEDNAFTQKRILGKDYFITEDGREVDYLQNPLPIPPKKHDRVSPKFDIEQIAKENASAIINGDKIVERLSDGMVKAGMGIENIVKLKEITTGGSFGSGRSNIDKMIDPLASDTSFEPIIDVLNLDTRDDFDIDIADGDDFDI